MRNGSGNWMHRQERLCHESQIWKMILRFADFGAGLR
jgi:hypothetical protein